jgi:hypothetical protein
MSFLSGLVATTLLSFSAASSAETIAPERALLGRTLARTETGAPAPDRDPAAGQFRVDGEHALSSHWTTRPKQPVPAEGTYVDAITLDGARALLSEPSL